MPEWWWTPVALLFAGIQLADVLMFGWEVYDHYTSWSVTFVAFFFLLVAFRPRWALYVWHAATVTTHFVLLTITVIIRHEPAHFMAISRDTGPWIAWAGHIALHAVPVFLVTHYTTTHYTQIRAHLNTISPWAYALTVAVAPVPAIVYSETMNPAARYGTTLSPAVAYSFIFTLSVLAAELVSGMRFVFILKT